MTNIVMAIALWCGNPAFVEHGREYTLSEINKCRQELFACVEKDQNGTKFLDCFKKQKLQ